MTERVGYSFSCEHMNCNLKFKTAKQKLIHHNKMEPECRNERNLLIKLIKKFKELLSSLFLNQKIDVSDSSQYIDLKNFYEETESKLVDPDYFHCLLGKTFEGNLETN